MYILTGSHKLFDFKRGSSATEKFLEIGKASLSPECKNIMYAYTRCFYLRERSCVDSMKTAHITWTTWVVKWFVFSQFYFMCNKFVRHLTIV